LLFMASAVVSVSILLLGVSLGWDVRIERKASAEAAAAVDASAPSIAVGSPTDHAPARAGTDPTAAAPSPTTDELVDSSRLETGYQPLEDLPPAVPLAADVLSESAADTKPSGRAYVVQVAAPDVRGEANVIANRLVSKGYGAYIQVPRSGKPAVFRVRVGTFATRLDAEAAASKLRTEEQVDPWIIRTTLDLAHSSVR
jgi:cell division septation protein DedD